MDQACPRCQRMNRHGMNFCPGCGLALQEGGGPTASSGNEGALRFSVPQQQAYPMPYYPMPGMYPMPNTALRTQAVSGGIIMMIAASFALIGGVVYLLDSWWWSDFWTILATMCFVSFGYGLFGGLGLFQRRWRIHSLLSCILLIVVGFLTLPDLTVLSIIILVLAIISVILVAVSWRQKEELLMMSSMQGAMMQQMSMGMQQQGAPPPYSPPMGAQPPVMTRTPTGFDQGAAPPPPVPVEDGDLIVSIEQGL